MKNAKYTHKPDSVPQNTRKGEKKIHGWFYPASFSATKPNRQMFTKQDTVKQMIHGCFFQSTTDLYQGVEQDSAVFIGF